MNDKRYNLVLLLANVFTVVLLLAVHFLPEKRFVLVPNGAGSSSLYIENFSNGVPSAEWTNAAHSAWKCHQPEEFKAGYLPCAWRIELSPFTTEGIDLSLYEYMTIKMNYSGTANKIRFGIRNYNAKYSTPNDVNSTKFNAIQVHSRELNKEFKIEFSAFAAADWWLAQYNIPFSDSAAEVDNAIAFTVDIGELGSPGTHEFSIERLEFRGKWVRVEDWYLVIMSVWLLGMFVFASKNLLRLDAKTKRDKQVINELSTDNEELENETKKLRRLSTVDALTQLYNRFGIDQIVAALSSKEFFQGPHYAVIVVDIDHFKRINDDHGHNQGDKILQHVAKLIQDHLRPGDYVGRWGGEEFLIIMPRANQNTAMAMAEKIREALLNSPCDTNPPLTVTASFGISERKDDDSFSDSFKRADNALYKAKSLGRNRCVYADELP